MAGVVSEYWLLVEYHPNKTLCEYLKQRTLDLYTLAEMALSLANGLAHLHMEQTRDGKIMYTLLSLNLCVSLITILFIFYYSDILINV